MEQNGNHSSIRRKNSNAKKSHALVGTMKLIKWTERRNNISSGATQLLLLAHTPVSRKVFNFFNAVILAGIVINGRL
jgi:hypothetical protein